MPISPSLTRRGLVATAAGFGVATLVPRGSRAQTRLTPDGALARLMDGNARFVTGKPASFNEDLTALRRNTAEKQEPFAAVLSCIDSRVPVELVFDQSIGQLIVSRVAANICTPEIIASLEFAAAVLGTAVIVVLGHASCGAVEAAITGKPVPGQISALFAPLRPAVERAGPDLDAVIRENAKLQAGLLRTASPVIAELVATGKLKVTAGFYDLAGGQVSLLD